MLIGALNAARSGRHSPLCSRQSTMPSSFGCLDQLVHGLWFVERLAHREACAHAAVEQARLEQLLVTSLRRDFAAVEHEDAVCVADGRQPMRYHERRSSRAEAAKRGEDDFLGNR